MQTATTPLRSVEIRENGEFSSRYHFLDLAQQVLRTAEKALPSSKWSLHDARTGEDLTDSLGCESWEAGEAAYLDEQTERALLLQG